MGEVNEEKKGCTPFCKGEDGSVGNVNSEGDGCQDSSAKFYQGKLSAEWKGISLERKFACNTIQGGGEEHKCETDSDCVSGKCRGQVYSGFHTLVDKGTCANTRGISAGCLDHDKMGDCSYCDKNYYLELGQCGKLWLGIVIAIHV